MTTRATVRIAMRGERGVALPTTLLVALVLSSLAAAFLAVAGMEPTIAVNLRDEVRARHLADAGIDWALDRLSTTADWSPLLTGGLLIGPTPLPGLAAAAGTVTVTVRNDDRPDDDRLTGVAVDAAGTGQDTNGVVVVTATGTVNGVSRDVEAVFRRGGDPADTTVARAASVTHWKEM